MQAKYDVKFEKREVHRAFDDIQASIAELQYYLAWFKGQGNAADEASDQPSDASASDDITPVVA